MKTRKMIRPSRVSVTLSFFGEKLDVKGISRQLDIKPTKTWNQGDIHRMSSGKELRRKTGYWAFEAVFNDKSFKDALDEFLTMIGLSEKFGLSEFGIVKVRLGSFLATEVDDHGSAACEIFFKADQVRMLAELGAEIMIDVSADRGW